MVRIITDTASDITAAQAQEMGVELVRLAVRFGSLPYDQRADEDFEEFYRMLKQVKELPTTSQPPPADYLDLYEEAQRAGDEVVVITLSSGLSGTYQSAVVASEMLDYDKIWVVDSKQAVIGQRLLVEYALRLRAKGNTGHEIAVLLREAAGRVRLYAALDTLKYLSKGGRIPKSVEIIGGVMGIKPVITVGADGKPIIADKARGQAGAVTVMIRLMDEHADIDPAVPVYFGYTHNKAPCHSFCKLATARYHLPETAEFSVGAAVGTHIGPGAFAVAYLEKPSRARAD